MSHSTTLSPVEHRRLITARRQDSVTWGVIHLFGSLKMAMLLLSTIALACAVATFTESGFNAKVAQYYIYKSPWFLCWLAVLCLNLFCVTLTRWPWQRQHHGFVITHFGIITLLIGAVMGRLGGFEAFMTLDQGQAPETRAIIQESTLTMQLPTTGNVVPVALPVEAAPPSPTHPRDLEVPGTSLRIRIQDYNEHLQEKERLLPPGSATPAATSNGPGVALAFHSNLMQQNVEMVVLRDSPTHRVRDFFGRATIEWADGPFQLHPEAGPSGKESQMIFALRPGDPVIAGAAHPSGWKLQLSPDPAANTFQVIATSPDGQQTAHWWLPDLMKQAVLLPGQSTELQALGYWPNFAMKNGQPATLSDQPLNPALLVQLGPVDPATGPQQPTLRLFQNSSGGLDYQLLRGWKAYQHGALPLHQPLTLGWADWQLTVNQVTDAATVETFYEPPAATPQPRPLATMGGLPGIQVLLLDTEGHQSSATWVGSGSSQNLVLGGVTIPVAFGLRTLPLPFEVSLRKFEIPRYEGTDNPANFISTLQFDDPATGRSRIDTASMNKPATFPGGFWRSVFGWNYKFSQASWNPQNLQETTVQILYDPGWPLKWMGSLMVVIGIFMLFYLRPQPAKTNAHP